MNGFLCGLVVRPVTSAPRPPRHLHRQHADAAGGALDEDAVAGAHARHLEEGDLGGEEVHRQRRPVLEIELAGQRQYLGRRDGHARGVAAEIGARRDRIALGEALDLAPHRRHPPRHLVAGHEGPRRRVGVEAEAHLHVGKVDARVGDVDGHLVIAGRADLERADLQRLGRAVLLDRDVLRLHRRLLRVESSISVEVNGQKKASPPRPSPRGARAAPRG
jgi:hypothetical protein